MVRLTDNDLRHTTSGGKVENINGYDIVFTSSNGSTLINHQLERYNPVTGELVAWVQIPLLSATVNTDFYLYFGNNTVAIDPSTTGTWDANFKAAYHLNLNQNDATSNGNNFTLTGTNLQSPAVSADGRDIESTEKMSCPGNSGIRINGDLTLETWVSFETLQLVANDNVLISCGLLGEVGGSDNFSYSFNYNGAGANPFKLRTLWETGAGTDVVTVSTVTTPIVINTWYHLAMVRDMTNSYVQFFVDGLQLGANASFTTPPASGSLTTLNIGEFQDLTTRDVDGDFDEIRISNSIRIPEWMQATYQSARIGSTFITYSTTACVPPDISVAGSNQTICTTSYTLAANTPTSGVGTWSVLSGPAVITNSLLPNSGITALGLGDNVFEWTITSGTCTSVSSVTITQDQFPTTAIAGSSQTLCISSPTITLNGNIPAVGTGSWTVISGTAAITTPTLNNTTVSGLTTGSNILQWNISNGSCPSSTSTMSIQVDPAASIALAGPNQTLCISNPTTVLAANTPTSGTGTWSVIAGAGTITNTLSPTSAVTGLGVGNNILQWTIVAAGSCSTTSSTMSIQVDQLPTNSLAGPSQTICIANPNYTMTGNTPTVGTGLWTMVLGSGTINSPNSGTTIVTNLGLGQNIFLWTITNGSCSQSASSMIITVDPLPSIAVAATNTIICISSPTAALIGNTPAVGTGTWSVVSGSGTITTPSSATTTATNLGLGMNILQWSIGTVGCAPTTSTISIQVDNVPTIANAGPNQTLCINNPTTTLNANPPIVGAGTWSIIQGSGVISSSLSPTSPLTGLPTGTNILQWTVTNGVCAPSISTMSIQVDNNTIFASAGPNQTLCAAAPSTTLAGNTATVGLGTWVVLVGSGSITTPSLSNSTITGLGTGTNILQWTIVNGVCSFNSSIVYIYVIPSPGVPNAGPSQTLCIGNPTTTIAANSPSLGTASWSVVSGSANIITPLTPTSNVLSLPVGNNVLAWTMTYSVCSLTSTLNIHVDNIPSVPIAGPNQTLCISTPTTVLAGNTPTSGIGTWSLISGTGIITTPTLATSSVTGLGLGTNILQWTIAGGGCGTSSSTMSIKVDNLPTTAIAGINQTLCISNPTTVLNGNVPVTGLGTWSVIAGGGTITTPTLATTSVTGLPVGLNVLNWTISNGVCLSSSTISIQVDNAPTIPVAGSNQTLCINSPSTALSGNPPTVGIGTWSIIVGNGIIVTPTLATTNVTGLLVGVNVLQWSIANGFCGSNSSTMSIQVDQAPTTATASANQTICVTNPTATVIGSFPTVGLGVWTLISGTGTITSANTATTTITNLGVGNNIFLWTISNGTCASSSASVQITVDPAPTTATAGANQTVCVNSPTVTMNGNIPAIGTGSWTLVSGTGTIVNTTLANTSLINLGVGNNVFAWTISNNCSSSTSNVTITVNQLPTIATAAANQTICITNPTVTINGNIPAIGTGSWTVFSGTGTITVSTSAITTVTNIGVGINVFGWTISNGVCPSSSASVQITVDPAPTIAAAGANQTVCVNNPVTMTANNAAVGTGSWSVISGTGTITSLNLETTTITNLGLGNNVFAWTIYGNCGSSTSNVTITVNPAPTTASVSVSQTLCIGSPSTTIIGNVPAIGTGSWTLVSGSGTITSVFSATTTVTNLGLGINIFEWVISSGQCAPSTASIQITVDPIPTIANAGTNQTICISSGIVTMAANTAAVGTGSWSVVSGTGTITSLNLASTTITNLSLGNNIFAWTIYSNCGSSTSNVTITVDQVPTLPTASPNQTLCVSSPTTTISGNVPAVGTGSWSLVSGSGTITSAASPTTTLSNLGVGVNIFAWTISNGACTPPPATVQITVDPPPTIANAGSSQTICITSSVIMNATAATIGTGSWTTVSGSGTITSTTSANTSISNLGAGTNIFAWTISNNCSSSTSTVAIMVDQIPSIASAGVDQSFCGVSTASLNAINPVIGIGTWSVISGGGSVANPTLNTSVISGLGSGTNTIAWTVANGSCPASTDVVDIMIDAVPTIANAGADQNSCSTVATLNGNMPTVGTGIWSVAGGSSSITNSTLNNSGITALSTPTNLLVWTISNGICPVSRDTVKITVLPPTIPAFAGNDTTIYINQITLNANNPASGSGAWSLVSGNANIVNPSSFNTLVNTLKPGVNTLKWTITDVCGITEDDINITLIDIELPNGVSPNGDGKNDYFEIPFIGSYSKIEIKIINRWGNLVYSNNKYNNNWDGMNQAGDPLAEDTYFYVLNLDNVLKTGYITIKR